MKANAHFLSHLANFFLKSEMFQTKFVQNIETQFNIFSKIVPFMR